LSPTFAELGVSADLVTILARRDIVEPFPIQAATIVDALAGRDVSGRAPTGSGKTLAFGIPLVSRVGKATARRPRALILVPTRELAAQVCDELAPLATAKGRTVTAVYGGVGYEPQRRALRNGADVLVACPGRLEDLVAQNDVRLDEVEIAVIDEADRMADMGFLPAVKRLLDTVRADRQTLLFSATLDGEVDVLVKRYQRKPVRHELADDGDDQGDVRHLFWKAERNQRDSITARLVERHWPAIVFCRTKHGADRLAKQLGGAGISAVAIHGNRSQGQRERALDQFARGEVQALVATDVAARGIHVDAVGCVIHFDPPADEKDYVHRSGRTGRAGNDGTVVSLVGSEVAAAVRKLQKALKVPMQLEPADVEGLGAAFVRTPPKPRPKAARPASSPSSSHRPHRPHGSSRPGRPKAGGGPRGNAKRGAKRS
jgi:superfamily II DNA/RNA helicase